MANVGMALSEATKKRLKAGRILLVGKSCAEVALAVGVARQTVYTWKRLLHVRTLKRVGAVIARMHGVRFGQT